MYGVLSTHLYPLLVKYCCDHYCLARNWRGKAERAQKTEHVWVEAKVQPGAAPARGKQSGGRDTFTSKLHLHMQACSCRSNGALFPVGLCLLCPSPDPWWAGASSWSSHGEATRAASLPKLASPWSQEVLWQLSYQWTLRCLTRVFRMQQPFPQGKGRAKWPLIFYLLINELILFFFFFPLFVPFCTKL